MYGPQSKLKALSGFKPDYYLSEDQVSGSVAPGETDWMLFLYEHGNSNKTRTVLEITETHRLGARCLLERIIYQADGKNVIYHVCRHGERCAAGEHYRCAFKDIIKRVVQIPHEAIADSSVRFTYKSLALVSHLPYTGIDYDNAGL